MKTDVKVAIAFRLSPVLVDRLEAATQLGRVRLTKTAIIERGLEMVLEELESAHAHPARRAQRK